MKRSESEDRRARRSRTDAWTGTYATDFQTLTYCLVPIISRPTQLRIARLRERIVRGLQLPIPDLFQPGRGRLRAPARTQQLFRVRFGPRYRGRRGCFASIPKGQRLRDRREDSGGRQGEGGEQVAVPGILGRVEAGDPGAR